MRWDTAIGHGIAPAIGGLKKRRKAIVSTLKDVLWHPSQSDTRASRHEEEPPDSVVVLLNACASKSGPDPEVFYDGGIYLCFVTR